MKRWALVFLLSVAGCASNPFAQFYEGVEDARTIPGYVHNAGEAKVYTSDSFNRDVDELHRRSYRYVGRSSFSIGGGASQSQLAARMEKIGAHVALVSSKYSHTVSGAVPLSIPQTSTSYTTGTATAYGAGGSATAYGQATTTTYGSQTMMMPYSVDRYDVNVLYFVKVKPLVGLFVVATDDETRKLLQTNQGVKVKVVAEDSPAYHADILPGDVVLSIGSDPISSPERYIQVVEKLQGQAVQFKIARGVDRVTKTITVQSYSSTVNQ